MEKKPWTLIAAALVLGTVYVFWFTDLGRARHIQINVSSRPFAPNAAPEDPLPIIFGLDQDWKLTDVRVSPLAEVSNAHPKLSWQLESKAGSAPTRGFAYGDDIPGMQRRGAGSAAVAPLVPGVPYRLDLAAGRARGSVSFTPQAAGEPR
ncbi:MAG: hypothetical protein J0L84_06470 [Verrucomicrobia bacterium]|nr:hypothetical protein [Verrucomicrobiota bacterium]